jgi:hypothetical protein
MENRLKISSIISLILTIISAGWLVFNFTMYELLKPRIVNMEPLGNLEPFTNFIWIGYWVFILYHISAFLTYIFHIQIFRKINAFNIVLLVSGLFSFLAIFGNWAILGDIGKEYEAGLDTSGEWIFLYIFLILNAFFYLLMFIFLFSNFRMLKLKKDLKPVLKDEMVFTIAQFVGIVCGLLGLLWIFINVLFNSENIMHIKFFGMITCVLLLLPYGLIVSYWLLIKFREKIEDWYDEKQWEDVARAGFTTLLISILVMLVLFIATFNSLPGGVFGILWFPFYLFTVLLIFSASTLYFYNRT